jgi:hypothetical protein
MLSLVASILEQRRMVEHTLCDALVVAINTSTSAMSTQIKLLSKFYCQSDEDRYYVKVRKDVKQMIYDYAKSYKVPAQAFLNAVISVYMKALMVTIWRDKSIDKSSISSSYPDLIIEHKHAFKLPHKHKVPNHKVRKLKRLSDQNLMRHHNYMEEFHAYMEQFGGLEKYINQNIKLMIHARPLEGAIGKKTELDTPKEQNPGTIHTARIWKRGRGYNITVLGHGSSYGEDAPVLEIGTVFRLYDIYRNIDWFTITI